MAKTNGQKISLDIRNCLRSVWELEIDMQNKCMHINISFVICSNERMSLSGKTQAPLFKFSKMYNTVEKYWYTWNSLGASLKYKNSPTQHILDTFTMWNMAHVTGI